jgi:flagellar biosynthetic protein FlhB
MADKPAAERTELPTPKRLQKARNEGQVPQSQELSAATALVVLFLAMALLGPHLFQWCRLRVEDGLSAQPGPFTDSQAFLHFFNARIVDVILVTLPILAILAITGILSNLAVSGSNLTSGGLKVKWNAINPATGIQNLCSARSMVRLLTSIVKLVFVSMIVWFYLKDKLEVLATLRWAWSMQIMAAIAKIIFGLGLRVGVAILIIGAADAYYQRWKYIQELKMTRQEVKEERKDADGSPEVKSKIRRIQMQLSMKRLRQEVPKANVILVNPTHVAVALRYDARTMEAPMLVAKGADYLAERIKEIARSYGIPIVHRPEIARAIYADVKPGQPIPEPLYVAVAEVLAMIYRLRQKRRTSSAR